MRIGLFTHSTNPRGGVVHALELADALVELGHHVCVHAPDVTGDGFFRLTRARVALIPAHPITGGLVELVRVRTAEQLAYLRPRGRQFDIHHAQDSLSGNVLAELASEGLIPSYVRTVHHLDDFAEPFLQETQGRSIRGAAGVVCVSDVWRNILRERLAIDATVVPNGVNLRRFDPTPSDADRALREHLGLKEGPVFLAVGGIEQRKNTLAILTAFAELHADLGRGQLLIVGGATLLDHSEYRRQFDASLGQLPRPVQDAVRVVGTMPDAQMPSVYRLADVLVFPSLREGFGLAVLEALASGTPVIVPRGAPFTEYLSSADALWVDPLDASSIASALHRALDPLERSRLIASGLARAAAFPWVNCAEAHVAVYRQLVPRHRQLPCSPSPRYAGRGLG